MPFLLPKLADVTSGLHEDSLNWVANLTVPICTSDVNQDMLVLLIKENVL